jgi:hypothetical protein
MGLFKKLKKAFKKVTRGIKKAVKGVVKGIKKVAKKISSSKILKALAIAAAIVVTGGAAVAAFTGGAGVTAGTFGSTFANWMMGTSQAVTGGTLFGSAAGKSFIPRVLTQTGNFAAKTLASPFKAVGTALGTAAGAVTDFTGLTTEASRAGVTPAMETAMADAQIAAGQNLSVEESVKKLAAEGGGSVADIQGAIDSGLITPESVIQQASTPTTLLAQEQAALAGAKAAGASDGTLAYLQQQSANNAAAYGVSSAEITTAGLPTATVKTQGTVGRIAEGVATGTATAVLSGAAMQYIQGDPEQQGSMGGLRTEGATQFDPLRVYAAERGIADTDISKYFTFGNTAEAGNMPLFTQQTIGVPA